MQCLWPLSKAAWKTSADKPQDRCYQESKSRQEFRHSTIRKEKGDYFVLLKLRKTSKLSTNALRYRPSMKPMVSSKRDRKPAHHHPVLSDIEEHQESLPMAILMVRILLSLELRLLQCMVIICHHSMAMDWKSITTIIPHRSLRCTFDNLLQAI